MSEKCRTCEKYIRADQYRETTDGVAVCAPCYAMIPQEAPGSCLTCCGKIVAWWIEKGERKAECEEKHVTTHPGVSYPVAERDHILSRDCWCGPTVSKAKVSG